MLESVFTQASLIYVFYYVNKFSSRLFPSWFSKHHTFLDRQKTYHFKIKMATHH